MIDYKTDLKAALEQILAYSDNELVIGYDGYSYVIADKLKELDHSIEANKMNYYLIQITDTNGEFENTTSVLGTALPEDIAEKAEVVAKTWYGEDGEDIDDDENYTFCNGCVVYVDRVAEISEPTFNELRQYLAVLIQ